jgi:predicted aldo/keto reductase-like oxidoreductase
MQYRDFGKAGWKISALSFGCMRLPILGEDRACIDQAQAARLIHTAVERGINYFDTAYPYHEGQSERFLGKTLHGDLRQKVKIATKMPVWLVKTAHDFQKYLDEQLQNLQTEQIDFYLLHGLNRKTWQAMLKLDVLDWLEAQIQRGTIGQIGFSFHDDLETFKQIVDIYPAWTFCQIQYNYLDICFQAGEAGLNYAASKGLSVNIMEPLLGGRLVTPPPAVQELFRAAPQPKRPVQWALEWLWNQPQVSTVLSGMSSLANLEENLAYAENARPGAFTLEDQAFISAVREKYLEIQPIPCTRCDYCAPSCPVGILIPRLLDMYTMATTYQMMDTARQEYQRMPDRKKADKCKGCQRCMERCPQKIEITYWLKEVHALLGST